MANPANTFTAIFAETLANSIGGTVVANTVEVSNATANGALIEFSLGGQMLPQVTGSITTLPTVLCDISLGANGNSQDTSLFTANLTPALDQNGAFFLNGIIILKANGKSGGANANIAVSGVLQIPTTALGGSIDTTKALYVGGASNGAINTNLGTSNTANLSFFFQPNSPTVNCNASITSLVVWSTNTVGNGLV